MWIELREIKIEMLILRCLLLREKRNDGRAVKQAFYDFLDLTWSRVCPVMRVCRSATAMEVIDALEQARRQHGLPTTIRVDQGSQFTSKELDLWAYANGITLDFSRPGKPTDNAYVESFNATVRLIFGMRPPKP
jgi:Integrase core domain